MIYLHILTNINEYVDLLIHMCIISVCTIMSKKERLSWMFFIKIVRKATIILKAKTKSVQSIKPGGKMKKKILLCLVSIRNPEIPQIPHNKSAL